jgi:tRNA pseudouridine38/39 synthase
LEEYEPHKWKKLRPPNQKKITELFETFKAKKFALKVCYIGTCYDGMAYQKATDNNTVEAYILKAMHTMSLIKSIDVEENDYTRAGRTDKGVSAMGNVISLKLRSSEQKS